MKSHFLQSQVKVILYFQTEKDPEVGNCAATLHILTL